MFYLLLITFLFSGFVQKWYLPSGTDGTASRMLIADTDRDGSSSGLPNTSATFSLMAFFAIISIGFALFSFMLAPFFYLLSLLYQFFNLFQELHTQLLLYSLAEASA